MVIRFLPPRLQGVAKPSRKPVAARYTPTQYSPSGSCRSAANRAPAAPTTATPQEVVNQLVAMIFEHSGCDERAQARIVAWLTALARHCQAESELEQ